MIPFHTVCPEVAERETLSVAFGGAPNLPAGEYAFVECYCEDLHCDCRRVFIEVVDRRRPNQVLASINFGWEPEAFYRKRMPWDPKAPREVVSGALDPINTQSEHSQALLELFQHQVLDEPYRRRLKEHERLFHDELRRRRSPPPPPASASATEVRTNPSPPKPKDFGIPAAHRERFNEVAALLEQFGQSHLDPELTGFTIELWKRLCRRKAPDCLRGKTSVWAASVAHVIARMNFLFDTSQPVHLTFDSICGFFQANKATVGGKATEIERTLRLQQHSEPGLCRKEWLESFTNVRLSNGMVLSWKMAKQMGYVPADAKLEDLG